MRTLAQVFARALFVLTLLYGSAATWAQDVVAEGLLPGMAVLRIDGNRVTLKPGQSRGAVKLLEVTAEHAVLEIRGERRRLGISERVGSSFEQPESRTISIRRNEHMQYVTSAQINGRRVRVLVDTGANTIAMNSAQARSLGIADGEGQPAQVQTASDVRPARLVTLREVDVGGLRAQAVPAMVLEGEQPSVILLGMTFLQHVQLQERDGILTLRGRW